MAEVKQEGKFTTIHRDDGKIVLASTDTYEHIGTHGSVGKGSVFSGGITPELINAFLSDANIPDGGGGIPADFPGGGYLLVKPYESAMQLQDASVKEGSKEEQGKSIPVAEVHTSQPITDFATDETTVLVFPYDPSRSDPESNSHVEANTELTQAKTEGTLYALATAFPGGWEVEGQKVPRASEWGGMENPTWAVIIPDSQANPMMERWNKLAGLISENR